MILKRVSALCGLLALAFTFSTASAVEEREFFNADKTKSFKGTVIGYDEDKKKVTIRTSKGGITHAKLSVFSEEDQKYVLDNLNVLLARKSINFSFKEVVGEGTKKTGFETGYDVRIYNRAKSEIKDIEIKYTIYYRVGSVTKGVKSVAKTHEGNIDIETLYPLFKNTVSTEKIKLVREVKKAKAGGG